MRNNRHQIVYAFIDSQNVHLSIKNDGWRLDFRRFYVYLQEKYRVQKAFLFIGYVAAYANLYALLKKAGYILIFKPTLVIKGKIKGNVDAELVLHAMIEYDHYDQAIIVSGDGDFFCLADYLDTQRKLLQIIVPNCYSYSQLLKPFAQKKIQYMNDLRKKLEDKKAGGHS